MRQTACSEARSTTLLFRGEKEDTDSFRITFTSFGRATRMHLISVTDESSQGPTVAA